MTPNKRDDRDDPRLVAARTHAWRQHVRMAVWTAWLAVSGATGCVDISGGAAELSWSLLTFEDQPIESQCEGARIERVRLSWEPAPGNAAGSSGMAEFTCSIRRGVTGFEIAEGPHNLWIEPICADGRPATPRTYEVPAALTRTMRPGQVVTLGSLLIVADDSSGLSDAEVETLDCTCCPGSFAAAAPQIDEP